MAITADQIDFSAEKSTPVISGAQKFVLPVPAFKDGGEPLVYPEGEKAGQPIADWEGKPIGDKGVVFFNEKDKAHQAVKGDGTGVIIMNLATEKNAQELVAMVGRLAGGDPGNLSLDQLKSVITYARDTLSLGDMYNSDTKFIAGKMSPVGEGTGTPAFGLHKRDDRDICQAVFVPGSGEFQGPAATPQQFENGAVILRQGDSVRLIQPDAFEASYKHANGRAIKVEELAVQGGAQQEQTNFISGGVDVDSISPPAAPGSRGQRQVG